MKDSAAPRRAESRQPPAGAANRSPRRSAASRRAASAPDRCAARSPATSPLASPGRAPPCAGTWASSCVRARHRPGRPHRCTRTSTPTCAAGSAGAVGRRRPPTPSAHDEEADPGHRPAPQDRAEDAGGQAPHPALHLCRGNRRHRAGSAARAAEREARRDQRGKLTLLPFLVRALVLRAARLPADQRPLTTTKPASSRASARCTWASPRRPTPA